MAIGRDRRPGKGSSLRSQRPSLAAAFDGYQTGKQLRQVYDIEGSYRWIWKEMHGHKPAPLDLSPAEVLQHLDPYDLEDLIYVWMQVSGGYLALPKARRTDPPRVRTWFELAQST
jgi:hypothetical protein